ncbi:GIY-YIG nuclease family protein [bacterium]|nr:MAG: GIY-YIG nuclease family protein [bacterium]
MFVYVLKSNKDGSFYIGKTKDVTVRLKQHNSGVNLSTKSRLPWELVMTEEYKSYSLATKRERFLKSGSGREVLGNLIQR